MAAKYPNLAEVKGSYINEAGLRALGSIGGSALISVEFEIVEANDDAIGVLCKGNPNLKHLSLTLAAESPVTAERVQSIVKYWAGLESISLVGWQHISNASLHLLSTLPCLKEISLSHCKSLTSADITSLPSLMGANLEVLKLFSWANLPSVEHAYCDNDLLQSIGECCPKLRHFLFDSRSSLDITEATFTTLFQGCPLLEALECTHLPDVALLSLAEYSHSLCTLKLTADWYRTGCTDAGIVALTSKCTKLRYLRLDYAQQLTNASILSLAEHCTGLEVLLLTAPTLITDHAMCRLFESCTQLTRLCLDSTPLITDRSIDILTQFCPRLKDVTLRNLPRVQQKTIVALACNLPELQVLEIEYFRYLSNTTIRLIAQQCKSLKHILILNCPRITVQALIALHTYGKRLVAIEIKNCAIKLTPKIIDTYLTRRPITRRVQVYLDDLFYII